MNTWLALTDRRVQCGLLAVATVLGVVFMLAHPVLNTQLAALGVLVVVAGLPHGGLDAVIAARRGWLNGWRGWVGFHLSYVALAALVAGLWLLFPGASLFAFLMISAWHFGGDWMLGRVPALRLLAGMSLLSLPALRGLAEVAALYEFLAPEHGTDLARWQSLIAPLGVICLIGLAGLSLRGRQWSDAIELMLLIVGGCLLPPLIFFAVYFCALHSPRNLLAEWVKLKGPAMRKLVSVLFYSSAAAAALGAVLWLQTGAHLSLDANLTRTLFIGLAAMTVPHMALAFVVQRIERR